MGDASTVPSRLTCCRRMVLTLAAVMPVASADAFERLASQPNRVQSWVLARRCTGGASALALSVDSRDDAAPHAQTASAQMALKITCIQRARLENHRRLFVRRSAVAPRHGSVEHPQVDSQLCAMMRGVGDKRGAEDLRARGVDEHPVAES